MPDSPRPTVVIVDDEAELRQLFSAALADAYHVREAASGAAALDVIDDDVDVVLLDRQMPGLSGDEVLARLREAGYDIPVAMVTANQPDFDVLEMGYDDYVVKPLQLAELHDVVDSLRLRNEYDEAVREYYALASKLASLRSAKRRETLETDERYLRAQDRLEAVKRRAMRTLDSAFEAGKFGDVVTESPSTERILEDAGDECESDDGGG